MPYNTVVLAKQVPDTKNVTGEAMKEDGTINRGALPAIFNPEDLNALEMALRIKEEHGGSVAVVCMGPPSAVEQLRQALYRGADRVLLLTDLKFAVADTLATSYTLSEAIRHLGDTDIVLCGRQAIDGDTAQVGPQIAEKLGIPQITYANKILKLDGPAIEVERSIEGGYERIRSKLPILLTVPDSANEPRPASAKKLMQYKKASCTSEVRGKIESELGVKDDAYAAEGVEDQLARALTDLEAKGLLIEEWNAQHAVDMGLDLGKCGRSGSPTFVRKIETIVLTAKDSKNIEPTDEGVAGLIHELIADHTIG